MTNRAELLTRWAELAPGECREARGMSSRIPRPHAVHYRQDWLRLDLHYTPDALLLAALIDAIRARGWILGLDLAAYVQALEGAATAS